ncbi:unnamed protein product [Brachionus calyciflorus]|uniref:MD-2-related lipid-recognition domain-containing protein n=1 Tax=Brachionus calyciflorus TaxID=104777 RepID=A0A814IPK2_9BILA|nr:unnamed protein product [Brachionus calyciflorus]
MKKSYLFLVIFLTSSVLALANAQTKSSKIDSQLVKNAQNDTKNNSTEISEITFKIISIKDCKSRKDSLVLKKISYPNTVKIPGTMELNATGLIKKKLPKDWNINTDVTVELPVLGLVHVPCEECTFKNICNETFLSKCRDILKKEKNSSLKCKCDLDAGTHQLPRIEIPLSFASVNSTAKMRMMNQYAKKGTNIKLDIFMKSAFDNKRFGCFNAVFQIV